MNFQMKKIILLLFCTGIIVTNALAQFSIGPEIGLNMSSINETTRSGTTGTLNGLQGLGIAYNYMYGARAGAMMEYTVTDDISVQSGFYYSMLGASISAQNITY